MLLEGQETAPVNGNSYLVTAEQSEYALKLILHCYHGHPSDTSLKAVLMFCTCLKYRKTFSGLLMQDQMQYA